MMEVTGFCFNVCFITAEKTSGQTQGSLLSRTALGKQRSGRKDTTKLNMLFENSSPQTPSLCPFPAPGKNRFCHDPSAESGKEKPDGFCPPKAQVRGSITRSRPSRPLQLSVKQLDLLPCPSVAAAASSQHPYFLGLSH